MNQLIPLFAAILALIVGSVLGYFARQSIAKKNYRTIESRLQKKVDEARRESDAILSSAKQKALQVIDSAQKEENERREGLLRTERLLLKRESVLDEKLAGLENREDDFNEKVEKLKET